MPPPAYAEFKGASELGSSTVLGNPYLGVDFAAAPAVRRDLGVRARTDRTENIRRIGSESLTCMGTRD